MEELHLMLVTKTSHTFKVWEVLVNYKSGQVFEPFRERANLVKKHAPRYYILYMKRGYFDTDERIRPKDLYVKGFC